MEVIVSCNKCPKAYRVRVDLIYKIYPKSLVCNGCGHLLSLEPFALDEEELRYFSSGEALKKEITANLKKLYPMPHVLFKARSLLTGYGNFKELETILTTDPALAGRVLKVANSAFYGMSGKVSSVQMAATVLGSDTLLQIITLVSNSKVLGRSLAGYGQNAGDLWRHSLAVAVCSQLIEENIYPKDGDKAFFAGLMHDSGKIILDSYILERRHIFKRFIDLTHASINTAENKILEFNHADIGCKLCRQWNLPEAMTAAIKYHHIPAASGGNRLAYVLHLADHMATELSSSPKKLSNPPIDALKFLSMTEIGVKYLLRKAEDAIEALEETTY